MQTLTADGLEYRIDRMKIFSREAAAASSEPKIPYILLDYKFFNRDEHRKLDLSGKFTFRLQDEFGNVYKPIQPPSGITAPKPVLPAGFPSLYPGDSYEEVLFFEPPLKSAHKVRLSVDGTASGINDPVQLQLPIPVAKAGTPDDTGFDADDMPDTSPHPAWMTVTIQSPDSAAVFVPGQLVQLKVRLDSSHLPSHVIVNAFGLYYEDASPRADSVYDLNIPSDLPLGPVSINVIAKWPAVKDGGSPQTASDSVLVYVKDAIPYFSN